MRISLNYIHSVRQRVAQEPHFSIAGLAQEMNLPEAMIVMALPPHMRVRAKTSEFDTLWETLRSWDNISIQLPSQMTSAAVGDEACSTRQVHISIPSDSSHICKDDIGSVWFVQKKMADREENYSVRFFNKRGFHLLSVDLGKSSGCCKCQTKNRYTNMLERFAVPGKEKHICKGCGNCQCKGHEQQGHHD